MKLLTGDPAQPHNTHVGPRCKWHLWKSEEVRTVKQASGTGPDSLQWNLQIQRCIRNLEASLFLLLLNVVVLPHLVAMSQSSQCLGDAGVSLRKRPHAADKGSFVTPENGDQSVETPVLKRSRLIRQAVGERDFHDWSTPQGKAMLLITLLFGL